MVSANRHADFAENILVTEDGQAIHLVTMPAAAGGGAPPKASVLHCATSSLAFDDL